MRFHGLHLVLFLALLVGCTLPGDAAPVLKIGLIAPFEGLGRSAGYAVLEEVQGKLALANKGQRFGPYKVALVALNDDSDGRSAAFQAQALAQDRDLLAVLGPWTTDTVGGAAPVLAAASIPALVAGVVESGSGPIGLLCPPAAEIAAALVKAAPHPVDSPLLIAGPENALARALEQAAPDALRVTSGTQDAALFCTTGSADACRRTVLYTGDAAQGADDLVRWRASGWTGALLGGPDLAALPILAARAGAAAEGAQAVMCVLPHVAASQERGDASVKELSALAAQSAQLLIDAIAKDVAQRGRPSREGVQAALAEGGIRPELVWLRCESGGWRLGREALPGE